VRKRRIFYGLLVLIIVSGVIFVQSTRSEAGVKGPCSECHTMHNSQDGAPVNEVAGQEVDAQSYLIKGADLSDKNPCLGCHKKNSDGRYFKDPEKENDAPQVNVDPAMTHNYLSAAGTYFYVTGDKTEQSGKSCRKGHNVVGMGESDDNEDQLLKKTPPGGTDECLGGTGKQLTCAGTSGCHGKRNVDDPLAAIKGGHHSPATNSYADRFRDGNSIATSYRMLYGVKGRVASNWEYVDFSKDNFLKQSDLVDRDDVNIYQGSDGKLSGTMIDPGDGSINGLCGECHGNGDSENGFHSFQGLKGKGSTSTTQMSSPWKRHPTDVVMKQDEQYGGYPNETGADYSREVPVGFLNISKNGGIGDLPRTQRVVLCVSCHRAHGSQYDDSLRWDYRDMATTSTTGNGCFRCHTNKYKKD